MEYKFRGKTITTGKWIYGSLIVNKEKNSYQIIDKTLYGKEIDPNTMGQYTGLKDKNGKEIYEGDIIQYEDIKEGVVEYSEQYAQFILKETCNVADECEALGEFNIKVFEVMGNIYDNKNLLESE